MKPADETIETLASRIDSLSEQCQQLAPDNAKIALELRDSVEAFHRQALQDLVSQLTRDPAANRALREATASPAVYTLLRRHGLIKPSQQEQVLTALDSIRADLKQHGDDVRLLEITGDKRVVIEMLGTADPGAAQAMETALRAACDWIQTVEVMPTQHSSDVQVVQVISASEALARVSAAQGEHS